MRTQERLSAILNAATDDYPAAWKMAEAWRQDKGKDLPDWPDYCFFPMAGWYAAVCAELNVDKVSMTYIADVARLAALGAWRYTQSIYRINPALYQSLIDTVPRGQLPVSLLMRMPEWCVYIETPGLQHDGVELHGFFAHLEWDANREQPELRLLLVKENGLLASPLHIGPWTITEAVDRAASEANKNIQAQRIPGSIPTDYAQEQAAQLYPLISLLLYVCSDGVEYRASTQPSNPEPKRTKKGWRLFAANHMRVWNLGDKIGEQLEQYSAKEKDSSSSRAATRPHIRRAHWHTFYAGPLDAEREVRVKWIPPLLIAASGEDDDE